MYSDLTLFNLNTYGTILYDKIKLFSLAMIHNSFLKKIYLIEYNKLQKNEYMI